MCLWVKDSHVLAPIPEVACIKVLIYSDGEWITPYQVRRLIPGHGWFAPITRARERKTEFAKGKDIGGGYIHAYTSLEQTDCRVLREEMPKDRRSGREYAFVAYARDVVASGGYDDIVCKALYIPAFDLTGQHRNAVLDFSKKR